jgi:quercetin dioxygenase-like cupin family protein
MFPETKSAKELPWQPGPYPGVELLILQRHEATGGMTVLRKFHRGIVVPAHTHRSASESVYVLSGEWEEDGKIYGPGTYFHAPRGIRHGPHGASTEVISLTIFDGPLTVE